MGKRTTRQAVTAGVVMGTLAAAAGWMWHQSRDAAPGEHGPRVPEPALAQEVPEAARSVTHSASRGRADVRPGRTRHLEQRPMLDDALARARSVQAHREALRALAASDEDGDRQADSTEALDEHGAALAASARGRVTDRLRGRASDAGDIDPSHPAVASVRQRMEETASAWEASAAAAKAE